MDFHCKVYQFVNQLAKRNPARFPEFRIHADGREARNRIYFVQKEFSALFLEEEIHARHAGKFERAERADSEFLDLLDLRGLELCWNQKFRSLLQIFRGVIVKL